MDQIRAVTQWFSGTRARIGHFVLSGVEFGQEIAGGPGGSSVVNSSGLNLTRDRSAILRRVLR